MAKVYILVLQKNLNNMKTLIYILLFLFVFKLQAQPPSKFYNKFGGNGIDVGYGIKETFDRQYIVAGSTSSFGYGALDAYLLLIDSMGQKIWQKSYGGALTDVAKSVVVNPVDSGFIFAGHSNSIGNGGYDVLVVRTDKDGNLIWQKSFGGFDWDFGNDIILAPDGNVVVCGYSSSSKYGKTDGYILKLNSNTGALIWEKKYGGAEEDEFKCIKLTSDNNYILTGKTCSYNDLKGDIYFLKTDINGDSLVSKTYGKINKVDFGNDIVDENINDYFIVGGTESYTSGKMDAFLFKTTNLGDSVWLKNEGKPNSDEEATKILLSMSYQGRYIYTFGQNEVPAYKIDPKTLLVNANGFYVNGGTIGGFEDEEFYDMANTKDKGFIGVGYTRSFGSVLEDVFVIKYDSIIGITTAGNVIDVKENKLVQPKIKVYPTIISIDNSEVTVESLSSFQYIIHSAYGHIIVSATESPSLSSGIKTISLESCSIGISFLTIISNNQRSTYKIIKIK